MTRTYTQGSVCETHKLTEKFGSVTISHNSRLKHLDRVWEFKDLCRTHLVSFNNSVCSSGVVRRGHGVKSLNWF